MVRGGIPQVAFGNWMQSTLKGRNKMEDTAAMAKSHSLYDQYWKIKAIPVQNITIPTYIVASYSSFIHTAGSLRTWRQAKSTEKWMRIHNAQEWADLYKP
jgi:predicted acyl esterase